MTLPYPILSYLNLKLCYNSNQELNYLTTAAIRFWFQFEFTQPHIHSNMALSFGLSSSSLNGKNMLNDILIPQLKWFNLIMV